MTKLAKKLENLGLKEIVLTHGSFVGADPLDLLGFLSKLLGKPDLSKYFPDTSKISEIFTGDRGNFTRKYEAELKDLFTSYKVKVRRFSWSSANHHIARLEACFQFVLNFSEKTSPKTSSKVNLLIGHSHAAQIFALFTLIKNSSFYRRNLLSYAKELNFDKKLLEKKINVLRKERFFYLTLGSPVKYPYLIRKRKEKLFHIINFRSSENKSSYTLEKENLRSILGTKNGDLIQKYGLVGSDFLSLDPKTRALNKKLDPILGPGVNYYAWQDSLKKTNTLSPYGATRLVDFEDSSKILPNFHKTAFGHGVYTQLKTLHFLFHFVQNNFFKM